MFVLYFLHFFRWWLSLADGVDISKPIAFQSLQNLSSSQHFVGLASILGVLWTNCFTVSFNSYFQTLWWHLSLYLLQRSLTLITALKLMMKVFRPKMLFRHVAIWQNFVENVETLILMNLTRFASQTTSLNQFVNYFEMILMALVVNHS